LPSSSAANGASRVKPGVVARRSELYAAGADNWESAPDLPVPVHGTAAAGIDGRFIVVAGATEAGTTRGATGRTFELDLR
jgi:hypothetical protein